MSRSGMEHFTAPSQAQRLRWARNQVKRFKLLFDAGQEMKCPDGKERAWVDRYRRAVAILLADKLTRD